MKKIIPAILSFCLIGLFASGQKVPSSLAAVPEIIKNKAAVVIHYENIEYEAESLEKATLKVHKIFTVLNEEGKYALAFHEYSSKAVSLEEAEIKVYDAAGKQTERYRKKDMMTTATGEGLIEDGYVTYYVVTTSTYPITLEIKYEQKLKSTLTIPDYRFIDSHEGVVESNFTATVPAELGLRYKAEKIVLEPVITENGKYKTYKWSVKNLAPMEYEEGAVSPRNRYPHVRIVTDHFSHYGFPGDLSSWKSFGTWVKNLYQGLDALPAERQQFFSRLVRDAPDEKEKIRRIYKYMQGNFRYVSIQLGIGGFRPFSAEFTDNKKYGDCKALSNYMKAALKSVGIESHVAIINAGHNELPVDPTFPSNDFNHVILCVPGQKDSTWLECTSSTVEFGELGTSTENRNALLITEAGGVLTATPPSHSSGNILSSHTVVNLFNDFSATTETVLTANGAYREIMNDILKEKKDRQKEAVVFYLGFKQPDDFKLEKDSTDAHKTWLRMAIAKVPEFNAGNKWFTPVRIHKTWSSKLPKSENRKLDFYFRFPFERYDTTVFKLPDGVSPDVLPEGKTQSSAYASYKSVYWYNEKENTVYSATTLILRRHRISSADYAGVKKFFDDLIQDDSQKIVLLNKPAEKKAF